MVVRAHRLESSAGGLVCRAALSWATLFHQLANKPLQQSAAPRRDL
jgi:hypothetical protein